MHIPDGFISLPTSLSAAVVASGGVGVSLRRIRATVRERVVPLAGLAAAFIFVLQMLNFPVAAGTSGHLLGGALVAILLGPWVGAVVVTVVILVQGLVFADGGVSALGLNVINMALVTALVGWAVFRLAMRILPKTAVSIVSATAIASWFSVVAASIGFTTEYAIGGSGGVPVSTMLGAMVGVHSLIGIGEGLISGLVVSAILASRADLVYGAKVVGFRGAARARVSKAAVGGFVAIGVAVAAFLVVVVAPLAASSPDGLERVALDHGIGSTGIASAALADTGVASTTASSPLAGYRVAGVNDPRLETILTGIIGLGLTFAVGGALMRASSRGARHREPAERTLP
jgi:cobalt/nickel transport system permease protein